MLPKAKYYLPTEEVAWLVRQFEFISYCNEKALTDKFVPREDVSIVFHFCDPPRMVSPVDQLFPPIFIAPLVPSANSIRISGHVDCFIATCKPTVLSRVLGISLAPQSRIYLTLPGNISEPLWRMMNQEQTAEGRMAAFTRFIGEIHPDRYIPDETDLIYEAILQQGINTNLHDIVSRFPVSERTLQRRFRIRIGTTPKTLVRIVRINYIWDSINSGRKIDYHDLVFLGNYFDQTHLIKDFKSITGETPDVFFRRNLGFTRILSGK
jgi:AraC-like DNA-binding protein